MLLPEPEIESAAELLLWFLLRTKQDGINASAVRGAMTALRWACGDERKDNPIRCILQDAAALRALLPDLEPIQKKTKPRPKHYKPRVTM